MDVQGSEEVRSLLTRVRAKVDFPVPLEPVIMITGGMADEKEEEEEGAASVCFTKISKQDSHDFGTDSVGTLWVVEYSCSAKVTVRIMDSQEGQSNANLPGKTFPHPHSAFHSPEESIPHQILGKAYLRSANPNLILDC